MLFVTSGPSGSGKTTLCRMVEERMGISHSISHTTRLPRPQEKEGKDYYFVSSEIFDQMIQKGEFIEWAWVHANRYGTSYLLIQNAKKKNEDLIFDLDVQGALALKAKEPEAVLIFIDVPDDQFLFDRLGNRGTEDDQKLKARIQQAQKERKVKDRYDYVIINENLEEAYQKIHDIIQKEKKK